MRRALLLIAALVPLGGCDDMSVQPKQKAYSPLVGPAKVPPGTVEYDEKPAPVPPVTLALLERGQDRFRIYCTPCHSELGDGRGMVVQRGFPPPPSYHIDRLREAPVRHFYDVITNGYGAMYSFADRAQPLAIGTINTVILVVSSFVYSARVAYIEAGNSRRLIQCCAAAWALGVAFLILKFGIERRDDFAKHLFPGPGFALQGPLSGGARIFFVFYFFGTALHGLHMIGGWLWSAGSFCGRGGGNSCPRSIRR